MSFSCIDLPERVELGKRDRAPPTEPAHGRGGEVHDARAALGHPLQLFDRLVEDPEGDRRRGEDRVLVAERPVLVHPLVQRVEHDLDGLAGRRASPAR